MMWLLTVLSITTYTSVNGFTQEFSSHKITHYLYRVVNRFWIGAVLLKYILTHKHIVKHIVRSGNVGLGPMPMDVTRDTEAFNSGRYNINNITKTFFNLMFYTNAIIM